MRERALTDGRTAEGQKGGRNVQFRWGREVDGCTRNGKGERGKGGKRGKELYSKLYV